MLRPPNSSNWCAGTETRRRRIPGSASAGSCGGFSGSAIIQLTALRAKSISIKYDARGNKVAMRFTTRVQYAQDHWARQIIGLDVKGDFNCCGNHKPLAFKCSNCGLIMAYCIESEDLFPNLNNLDEIAVGVNALDPTRAAFSCPHCGHSFEYPFLRNEAYRVTLRK